MKAKLILAALVVLASTMAFANGPGDPRVAVINQKNPDIFKVIYEGEKKGNVRMTIFNQNDQIVFSETTRNMASFSRKLNFGGMPYGEYTIKIADGSGNQSKKIVYANVSSVKDVQVSKTDEEGKYLLAVSNDGAEQINVRIFDGADNLVHNEDVTINGNLKVVYNLKKVAGVPSFEVTDRTGNVRTVKY